MSKKLTTFEFIQKASILHEAKYNYKNTIYIDTKNKVSIWCNIHGEFLQTPNKHLQGQGCPKCASSEKMISNISTKDFIRKANQIHKHKYCYTLTEYVAAKTKIKILCKIHGEFTQTPDAHLRGMGCTNCKNMSTSNRCRKSLQIFINQSNLKHNFKYDYSLANYITSNTKINIICPIHGSFSQRPNNHVNKGDGCPYCKYEHIGWTKTSFKKLCDKNNNRIRNFIHN